MKAVYLICQVLLGLLFIVFGLNGFLHFMPSGPMPPPDSLPGKFFASMSGSGWLNIVSGLQIVGGLLVLVGVTAPIGLVILGPIIFNALLFHILLVGGKMIGPALFAAILELILIYGYRSHFTSIFNIPARPTI